MGLKFAWLDGTQANLRQAFPEAKGVGSLCRPVRSKTQTRERQRKFRGSSALGSLRGAGAGEAGDQAPSPAATPTTTNTLFLFPTPGSDPYKQTGE